MYPITVLQVFINIAILWQTHNTPNIKYVAINGTVKNLLMMKYLESELTLIMQNGNYDLRQFYEWVHTNCNVKTVDDGYNDSIGL